MPCGACCCGRIDGRELRTRDPECAVRRRADRGARHCDRGPCITRHPRCVRRERACIAVGVQRLRLVLRGWNAPARETLRPARSPRGVRAEPGLVRSRFVGGCMRTELPHAAGRPGSAGFRGGRVVSRRGGRHRRHSAVRAARSRARADRRDIRGRVSAWPSARWIAAALELALAVPDQRADRGPTDRAGVAHVAAGRRNRFARVRRAWSGAPVRGPGGHRRRGRSDRYRAVGGEP